MPDDTSLNVAIAAGEASGDSLGAGLIAALGAREPKARFYGIAGPRMRDAGCEAWHRTEELSVMGLAEVLKHLPRLLRLRRRLVERLLADPPDVFVGIDAPAFNLPLARRLKRAGIPTVQYVSPQVWAWRQSRVHGIRKDVDLVLCVLPFETDFYAPHGVPALFVGHPLADEIPLEVDRDEARRSLDLDGQGPVLALLPGSRQSEVSRLAVPFFETVSWLSTRCAGLESVVALANEGLATDVEAARGRARLEAPLRVITGRAREVMIAADAVLTASGTASLEALLLKRPMVVTYRMTPFSYWLVRKLGIARLPYYTLPNLLAGRALVPEHFQDEVRADVLGPPLLAQLTGSGLESELAAQFDAIHRQLRGGGSDAAAAAVLDLAESRRRTGG